MMGPAAATQSPSACAPEESVWYVSTKLRHSQRQTLVCFKLQIKGHNK